MEAFQLCVALGPVAVYLLLLGTVSLSRRPLLVSGVRDAAALALAVSGMALIGPIELFVPFDAAGQFGPYMWVLLLALYAMGAALWLLVLRPRLVIYNVSVDFLRPILAEVVSRLDADARWAGDSLAIPELGVQLCMDGSGLLRGVSLVSAGGRQEPAGWRRLESALGAALARGSRPQSARPGPDRRRAGVRRRHAAGHLARSPGRRPVPAGHRPMVLATAAFAVGEIP